LAADAEQYSLAFVQYHWATVRAGKTGGIDATLGIPVQVPAAVPTRAEKESDPDWRRAETAGRSS
jgi:hypothetical protein